MHERILTAVAKTFGFSGWNLNTEFEIKYELFHQLAKLDVAGTSLAAAVPGTPSCRLHAEGRVLSDKPQRADLLLCDPSRRNPFNYEVSEVLELKQRFSERDARVEIEKFRAYGRSCGGLYLIAPIASAKLDVPPSINGTPVHLLHRTNVSAVQDDEFSDERALSLESAVETVRQAVDATLELYGRGRVQYHSFFWCNWPYDTGLRHSFPSEGDFNAQLYHALRQRLPASVEIRCEVHPPADTRRRIDLVVSDRSRRWAIPIDVKMNWDQFKPSYKDGVPQVPEAKVIMGRLRDLGDSYPAWHAMLIVIQGHWRLPRDIRAQALPLLEDCEYPLELVMYCELRDRILRRSVGRAARGTAECAL
jgi:hypothetical protein